MGDADEPFPDVPAPDPTRQALYALMEAHPAELSHYGGMADAMDELGYAALGHAYRWMWTRGRYPIKREWYSDGLNVRGRRIPAAYRWGWYREQVELILRKELRDIYPHVPVGPHLLPSVLILQPHRFYPSHQAAVMDLAKWLQRVRDAYDVTPTRAHL